MAWNTDAELEKLEEALKTFDKPRTRMLCDDLVARLYRTADTYPVNPAKKLLNVLRHKRCFAEMQKLADAFIQTGAGSNTVWRLYAQALLDQGHTTSALLALAKLVADSATGDPDEYAEARGLLGRAYKQLYVTAQEPGIPRNQEWLDEAARAYYETYRTNPGANGWHGINVVAVADRCVRDRVPLRTPLPPPATLAKQILAQVDTKDARDVADLWDFSTAAEACIALGDLDGALGWIHKYVKESKADSFEFASTLRQLEEVWGLPRSGATKQTEEAILSLLRATILEREGGKVEHTADGLRSELREMPLTLERVFGTDRFQSVAWYRTGLARCAAVGRIAQLSGSVGTGFLLGGTSLHESLGDELYLLTNSHVISPSPEVSVAIHPEDAIVTFEGLPGAEGKTWTVKRVVFTSPIGQLDATLVQLDRPVEGPVGYPIAAELPPADGERRTYVVGHPLGGGLSFSLQDNLLLDWDETRVHYRTPTEPGSSGSPVFDDQWKLIALHHAGRDDMPMLNGKHGTYKANEGINVHAIVADIRATLG